MEMKEMTMEARLLIAFLLMGVVLLVSQYLYSPVPPPPAAKADVKQEEKAVDKGKSAASAPQPAEDPLPPAAAKRLGQDQPGQVQAEAEEILTMETDVHRVVFSNRGAVVRSWVLKAYKDREGKPLELVYQKSLDRVPAPMSIAIKGQTLSADPNKALFKIDRS